MTEVNPMESPDDDEAFYMTRAQVWEEERRAEGRAEGRVMAQRESIQKQAAMKFDVETAARLEAVLEGVTDETAFDGVLAALIECDTPSDLLARSAVAMLPPQRVNPAVGPGAYTGRAQRPLDAASAPRSVAGMEPDATYKRILSFAFMVEELLHWLVAERHGMHALVDALDFSTLTRMHEQSVSDAGAALHRRSNDMVWRVHLHEHGEDDALAPAGHTGRSASPPDGDGAEPEASGTWLCLVVMLEFQSTVDYLMPLRIRNYVDGFHMERWRGRRFRSTDRLAPVLPIVLYVGNARWTAAQRVIDLVTPQPTQAGGGESVAPWRADPRFAGDGYVLLDSHRVRPEDLSHDNAAALLAGLENPTPSTLPELVGAVCRRLQAPELRELRDIMLAWAGWRARQAGLTIEEEDMAQVNRMENPDDIEAFYMTRAQVWEEERRAEGRAEGRTEGRAEGRAEGRTEGRVMGQRESIQKQAAMKFDAETAARLGAVLEDVTDQAAFDGVLAALLECDTPSDLLARATEARRRTNGRNADATADC